MQEAILLVDLMRQALQQSKKIQCDEKFDSEKLEKLTRDQNLVSFVYPALMVQDDEICKRVVRNLTKDYNEELHRALVQQIEMENLVDAMEQKGFDCLPLKGYFMKNYYEESTFRSMTDFDVLINNFDEKKLQCFMEEIGYEVEEQGDEHHDVYIKKPYMVAELHKNLSDEKVEREIPQIDEWLANAWDRCILTEGKQHTYEMTEEDFYIYHLIHLFKHIRHGGISIRPLVDIQVFLEKANERLDWDYINRVLNELKLTKFEFAMKSLSKKCFGDSDRMLSEEEYKLLMFFFENGLFGNSKSTAAIDVVTKGENSFVKGTISSWLSAIFQPARLLVDKYPILEKYPILLPIVWVIRIFRVVFKEKHKVDVMKEANKKDEYNRMREIFQIAGIINK